VSDRELLELAAKAAGIDYSHDNAHWKHEDHCAFWSYDDLCTCGARWNPLTDDGDALRLFCALPWLCIEISDLAATVCERRRLGEPSRVYLMFTEWLDKHNGDLAAATRRAIVRAAAEIGRNMP